MARKNGNKDKSKKRDRRKAKKVRVANGWMCSGCGNTNGVKEHSPRCPACGIPLY